MMNSFPSNRPPHVAQQSRRDRLRYQPAPPREPPLANFQDVPHHSDPMYSGTVHFADGQAMYYASGVMLDYSAAAQAEASDSGISPNPTFGGNLLFAAAAAAAAASHVGNNVQNSSMWKMLPGTDWAGVNPGYEGVTMSSSMTTTPDAMIPTQQSQGQSQFGGGILPLGSSSATPDEGGGLEVPSVVRPTTTPWMGCGGNSELPLLHSYSSTSTIDSAQQQWRSLSNFEGDGSTQGLSLSLSSMLPSDSPLVPSYDMKLETDAYPLNSIPPGVIFPDIHDPNPTTRPHSNELPSSCKSLFVAQGVAGLPAVDSSHRVVGPLGPFTGYATILRNSKFLQSAQQLLDECCHPATSGAMRRSPKAGSPGSAVAGACDVYMRGGRSGVWEGGHFGDPHIQQRKAKLLFMQGEVCRRRKHYNQQIQMVISSFESVAGLSTAMPFLSLALKSIVKQFRFLRSLISEQLLGISRVLGEELASPSPSPTPPPCHGKSGASAAARSNPFDQPICKRAEEAGLLEQGRALARPQRGLPERAVAVLRAWLFDHFLHPYPTDTDKLMLATQTGLTRNQVSNWFINARVRVWKPMVEEIHTLESKGLSDVVDLNSKDAATATAAALVAIGNEGSTGTTTTDRYQHQHQPTSNCGMEQQQQYWHPAEKRSRLGQQHLGIPEGVDGGIAAFPPYPSGFEMGGGVSLTLGLKHDENSNQQQQQQQIRSYFGSHLVHEFVG